MKKTTGFLHFTPSAAGFTSSNLKPVQLYPPNRAVSSSECETDLARALKKKKKKTSSVAKWRRVHTCPTLMQSCIRRCLRLPLSRTHTCQRSALSHPETVTPQQVVTRVWGCVCEWGGETVRFSADLFSLDSAQESSNPFHHLPAHQKRVCRCANTARAACQQPWRVTRRRGSP